MKRIEENILFVAEISANHNGSFKRAKELVTAAINSGANAVKLQTYTAETMTIDSDLPDFKISGNHKLWGGKKLFDLYAGAQTPWEWHSELFELCRSRNVLPFSTPFDLSAVEFLESLKTPIYKIASLETSDHRLIRAVAETGKPLIVSTGATEWKEIEELVSIVHESGNTNLTLLVCTSAYPADPIDSHLNRLETLQNNFGVKVGLSDHTLGIGVSIAAIALGATVIEKHITLRRSDGGADGAFSMEPEEFALLVREGKSAFKALGNPQWSMQDSEMESRRLRRSLYVVNDVLAGDLVSESNVRAIRPGGGLSPNLIDTYLGMRFNSNIDRGTPLTKDIVN